MNVPPSPARPGLLRLFLPASTLVPLLAGAELRADRDPIVSLASLVEEMTDHDAIAKWPAPEFVCRQASSHDRRSISPDEDGWFANDDYTGRVRVEEREGRREEVLMDEAGPGCIVRFWLTTDSNKTGGGMLRIYLDHDPAPAMTFPAFDLLSGALDLPEPFATAHPGYTADDFGGNTMMLPIPYAKHCKVTWEERSAGKRYFQINYRRYSENTSVRTFSPAVLDAARPQLAAAAKRLLHPPAAPMSTETPAGFSLAPGAEHRIDLPAGPAAVRFLQFHLKPPGGGDPARALRSLVVKMAFDGKETVWCPAGDFFGSGVGVNAMHNWYSTVEPGGTMTGRWVMPYRQNARVTLENLGTGAVTGTLGIHTGAWSWDDRSMHFHAAWHHEAGLRTPPAVDWNFVSLRGKGVYAGDTLSLYNEIATWYGEGDEKIRVDREAFPSHFGTGTEDYYGYSFAPRFILQTPFANLTRVDQEQTQGHNVMSRSRNLDGIPFRESLDFNIELMSWKATRLAYAATSRWYAFPGGASNVGPNPMAAAAPIPTLADAQLPPPAFDGVIDAELAIRADAQPGLALETQNMQDFGVGIWSRGEQLLVRGTRIGDFVILKIPAPDSDTRQLFVWLTKAPDYGILSFSINGQASAAVFDGYAPHVIRSERISLGPFAPVDEFYEITIRVSGAHPASTGNRYYFGIDCFALE